MKSVNITVARDLDYSASLPHGLGRLPHGLSDPHVGAHRLGGVAGRCDLARRHVRPLLLLPELDQLLRQYSASRLRSNKMK